MEVALSPQWPQCHTTSSKNLRDTSQSTTPPHPVVNPSATKGNTEQDRQTD